MQRETEAAAIQAAIQETEAAIQAAHVETAKFAAALRDARGQLAAHPHGVVQSHQKPVAEFTPLLQPARVNAPGASSTPHLTVKRAKDRKAYDRIRPLPEGWRRFKWTGDNQLGVRVKDGEGFLMVVNRRLRLKDIDLDPVEVTKGWFIEEVAGIPVRSMAQFRAALATVDRAGGQEFEVVMSEGERDGRTTVRDYRRMCDDSPFASGRKQRPEHADQRVSASMYTEVKKGGEAPVVPHEFERAVSLL